MRQEDYLMRQILRMTEVLAGVLFRKKNQQYDEALAEIQQTGEQFLGLDLNAIHTLTVEDVQEALHVRRLADGEHITLIAALLHHQGDCFAAQHHDDLAQASYHLTLHLYLDVFAGTGAARPLDLPGRVDALLTAIDPFAVPADTAFLLFRYLAARGRYGRAEDLLFHLAEEHPTDALLEEGRAFYKRLRYTSYRLLDAGNLPPDEIQEGWAAFLNKFEAPEKGTSIHEIDD